MNEIHPATASTPELKVDFHAQDMHRAMSTPARMLAIVVVYKMQPNASSSLQTLTAAMNRARNSSVVRISVADNTPGGQRVEGMAAGITYQAFPGNPGLAPVYNLAIEQAESNKIPWLLTLDQDTDLPADFLIKMAQYVARHEGDDRVAAIVPRIFDGERPVSPLRFAGGFLPCVVGPKVSGVVGEHASALNSASLLRVSALRRVGGYDERFPLNNSDTALFQRLDHAGFKVMLAGDIAVRHELAIMQRHDRMTIERYRQLLIDERDFWDLHMSALGRTERAVRLAGRMLKVALGKESAEFQRATFDELRYRLLTRRTARMRAAAAARS